MDNLNSCLPYIGSLRPGLWWIDAICINQADTVEKNHQVAIMRYIYAKASRVFAWLGILHHRDQEVIRIFTKLEKFLMKGYPEVSNCKIRWENLNLEELDLVHTESDVWPLLIGFFGKPYFSRTWVLQELMFEKGRKNVIFGCGTLEWPATALWRSVHFLHSNKWIQAIHEEHQAFGHLNGDEIQTHIKHQIFGSLRDWHNALMHTKIVSTMHANGSIPLRTLILATAKFETRDPRDKVLALLGMTRVSNVSAYGITIDYSQPVEELYRDITGCLTVKTQSYHLLALAQDPCNKRLSGLPSWVPDYSMPSPSVEVGDSITDSNDLSAGVGSITWSRGSPTLGVRASILEEAEIVAENVMSGLQARDLIIWLQILAKYLDVDIKVILYRLLNCYEEPDLDIEKPVDEVIYCFLRILLDESSAIKGCTQHFAAFLFQDPMMVWSSVVTGWEDIMRLARSATQKRWLGQATRFKYHASLLTTYVLGLKLFITKSGRAGLGPRSMCKGDFLSQCDGRNVHYCLRPTGSGHYCLLGGTFFNGWSMNRGSDPIKGPEMQRIFLD